MKIRVDSGYIYGDKELEDSVKKMKSYGVRISMNREINTETGREMAKIELEEQETRTAGLRRVASRS